MLFSEMKYERPALDDVKRSYTGLTERLRSASTFEEANRVFLEKNTLQKHIVTMGTLVSIRHSIDTKDEFYSKETDFWNNAEAEIEEFDQIWTDALLESPFRNDFLKEYGELMFVNAEMAKKTFSPEIIPDLQAENKLANDYEDLLASAQVPFEGGVYTLSQMTPFKNDPDDDRRRAAWIAEGQWFKDNQAELDRLYDELVRLRDSIGKKLGYGGYIPLAYYRMGRNCYTKEDVAKFREAVVKYVVPVASEIYRRQAKRLGKEYPMDYSDNTLEFRDGNPKPVGTPEDIVNTARAFYTGQSPETDEFFNFMFDNSLLDLLSTEGKASGGYCTLIPDYDSPFIFANFNGTQGDVEVLTHEGGHAFECYMNRKRIPMDLIWPSMEACEVHSMSMEFFGEKYADEFFGADAEKFLYSHLAGSLTFIPYGTAVDHFQHIVFEKPDMTPAERHQVWKEMQELYMPYVRLDGKIPFWGEGECWQQKHHIYSLPFYYIDYCLAQTVALAFWAMIRKDPADAWDHYMKYTLQGGSDTFVSMLKKASLPSPFDEGCLRDICSAAADRLKEFDF